ncbi:MAG: hypothetical protein HC927_13980 [Deltaproteobacteria bacterium]|nr:hypothetical protein [Deltaproteobacteria bacterium]
MATTPKPLIAALALPLLLFAPPRAAAEDTTFQAPPAAKILEAAADEYVQSNGLHVRWSAVTYELSTGHQAEVFVEVDGLGRGDGYIFVESEILVHVSHDPDARDGTITTWIAPDITLPEAALLELPQVNVAEELFAGIADPRATKCSNFGKKAVKAAKYIWIGLSAAAGAACCAVTTAGCPLCVGGATVVGAVGADIANDYCE